MKLRGNLAGLAADLCGLQDRQAAALSHLERQLRDQIEAVSREHHEMRGGGSDVMLAHLRDVDAQLRDHLEGQLRGWIDGATKDLDGQLQERFLDVETKLRGEISGQVDRLVEEHGETRTQAATSLRDAERQLRTQIEAVS